MLLRLILHEYNQVKVFDMIYMNTYNFLIFFLKEIGYEI
jgi:hypothetical protein